jgi:AsmA protein
MRFDRRIALIAGAIALALMAALAILPRLVPDGVYRERIQAAASEAVGRPVTVSGDIRISIFPALEVRAGSAEVANPAGFGDGPFASMRDLRAEVELWPLLFRRVEVDRFILVEPRIELVRLEDGRNNWTFERAAPQEEQPTRPAKPVRASLGDVRIVRGFVSYDDRAAGQAHRIADLDLMAEMDALDKPFRIRASGSANDLPFSVNSRIDNPQALIAGLASDVELQLKTKLIESKLRGSVKLGEAAAYDLQFDGAIPDVVALADRFQVAGLPAREALGRVTAAGRLSGRPGEIVLQMAEARHDSDLLDADFEGVVRLADFIYVDISAKAEAPRLADLASAAGFAAPGDGVLGKASASTKISGKLGALAFSDVALRHDSGLLTLSFDGEARYGAGLTYSGRVYLAAPDLKRLAAATGAQLPDAEGVYTSFSMSGLATGDPQRLRLTEAVVQLDAIKGEGEAALALSGRPNLVAVLKTGPVDLTPYAAAAGAPSESQDGGGWGDSPIDLTPLRLADATLSLEAESLRYQKFDFGPTKLAAALANGRLAADLSQTSLFGGKGSVEVVADGAGAAPAFSLKADIKGLGVQPLLTAAADFRRLEGDGNLEVDLSGSGATLQTLMSSLDGSGKMSVGRGAVQGVDLAMLVQGAQTMLADRSLPLSAFGKDAKTTFRDLDASFSVRDGVAAMKDLKIENETLAVTGGGSLDLGERELSLSLFPELKNRNSGVQGYGLPFKVSGSWNSLSLEFDFEWLVRRAKADARARVESEIERELREELGEDVSRILGGRTKPEADPSAPPDAATPAQPTAEDLLRQEASKALGGLLKRN